MFVLSRHRLWDIPMFVLSRHRLWDILIAVLRRHRLWHSHFCFKQPHLSRHRLWDILIFDLSRHKLWYSYFCFKQAQIVGHFEPTSDKKTSKIRQAICSGNAVVKSVRNQDEANIDTHTFWDWKWTYKSDNCSWNIPINHMCHEHRSLPWELTAIRQFILVKQAWVWYIHEIYKQHF